MASSFIGEIIFHAFSGSRFNYVIFFGLDAISRQEQVRRSFWYGFVALRFLFAAELTDNRLRWRIACFQSVEIELV